MSTTSNNSYLVLRDCTVSVCLKTGPEGRQEKRLCEIQPNQRLASIGVFLYSTRVGKGPTTIPTFTTF